MINKLMLWFECRVAGKHEYNYYLEHCLHCGKENKQYEWGKKYE